LTDHPSPGEIARLARGTLSRAGRHRLMAHLLRGCPDCARLIAPALALMPEILDRHVAGRRRAVSRSPLPRVPQPPPEPESALAPALALAAATGATGETAATATNGASAGDSYDLPVERACTAAVRRFHQLERERRTAVTGLATAGAAPAPEAAGESGQRAAPRDVEPRHLRERLKVEMLIEASWELRYSDPHEMLQVAGLALFAAERLKRSRYGRAAIADLRARAWAELANSHRIVEDLDKAEHAMAKAVFWQSLGSGDPWLVARIADLMASLLADQRRLAEAGELLVKVHGFYGRMGDRHLAGRALISRGIFAGYDNDPRRALALLVEGMELIEVRRDPRLVVQALHAILWNLVQCGRYRQARIHLWRSRPLFLLQGGRLSLLRLSWLEGRIHEGLGDLERAERELLATREGFAAAGSPYNAALVALDLAGVWLRQGKTQQVRQLVEEMIATFRALRIAREAVAALLILREACDREEATLERLRAVTVLLTELERQPQCRPCSGPVD
jgi:hypothetical protein